MQNFFQLRWHTIKELEKRALKRKYSRIQTSHIKAIGVDEIYVSRSHDNGKYLTIIRDLESGAVIHIGEGKGTEALKQFENKIRCMKRNFEAVAMDMSKAFIKWVSENLPNAEIVFDHFHVIKMVNEKLDNVRRKIIGDLDDEHKKLLKNQRFLFFEA